MKVRTTITTSDGRDKDGNRKSKPPGTVLDLPEADAQAMIARGQAKLPEEAVVPVVDGPRVLSGSEAKAAIEADKAKARAKARADAKADADKAKGASAPAAT